MTIFQMILLLAALVFFVVLYTLLEDGPDREPRDSSEEERRIIDWIRGRR